MASKKPLGKDLRNANRGTQRGREMIERSLRELGAGRSILVDKEGRIIAGNKTYETWEDMAGDVEIVRTTGDKLIVVQRDDLDLDEPTGKARRLAYYDNRTSQVDLDWNPEEILQDINAGFDFGDLWTEDEIDSLLADIQSPNFDPASIDEQGKLDELADKSVECPNCGHRFTP